MHSNERPVARTEAEKQLLRFLCAGREDTAARREICRRLASYSWCEADHGILFECIAALLPSVPLEIRTHLPAELTRRGFPDISCEFLSASANLNAAETLALAEELLRASQ